MELTGRTKGATGAELVAIKFERGKESVCRVDEFTDSQPELNELGKLHTA